MFKLSILAGDDPNRSPAAIAPGWEMTEIPVALQVKPFESEAIWIAKRREIAAWGLPPIKVASHFLQFFGLIPVGPGADWDQLAFWTERAFSRLAGLGVEVVGVYGGFFRPPADFPMDVAWEQALTFVNMMADEAEQHNMLIALEPIAEPDTLWPMYPDGIAFAKEVGRPSVRVMADMNYFIRGNQPLELIADDPSYCLHVHIAGEQGQPGVGDMEARLLNLFRVLRDIGYLRGVSAACPWVSTDDGPLDYGKETAKALDYLKGLRAQVYAE
jgi:sugar phosphate isomerase/epimerase